MPRPISSIAQDAPWACFAVQHTWLDPELPAETASCAPGVLGVTCSSTVLRGDALRCNASRGARLLVPRTSVSSTQPKR